MPLKKLVIAQSLIPINVRQPIRNAVSKVVLLTNVFVHPPTIQMEALAYTVRLNIYTI